MKVGDKIVYDEKYRAEFNNLNITRYTPPSPEKGRVYLVVGLDYSNSPCGLFIEGLALPSPDSWQQIPWRKVDDASTTSELSKELADKLIQKDLDCVEVEKREVLTKSN